MTSQHHKSKKINQEAVRERSLADLSGIGPAMLRDFNLLGIKSVSQLKKFEGRKLYDRLCRLTGTRQDPCVLDTFICAVAQARNPKLPKQQCNWWWWSKKRLAERSNTPKKLLKLRKIS